MLTAIPSHLPPAVLLPVDPVVLLPADLAVLLPVDPVASLPGLLPRMLMATPSLLPHRVRKPLQSKNHNAPRASERVLHDPMPGGAS